MIRIHVDAVFVPRLVEMLESLAMGSTLVKDPAYPGKTDAWMIQRKVPMVNFLGVAEWTFMP
jgi:hypothetical protein